MDNTDLTTQVPTLTDVETIGSDQEVLDIPAVIKWAKTNGNTGILRLLIQTANVSNNTHIGICLHFLAKPSICHLLNLWGDQDTDAGELRNLALDLRASPHLLKAYPTVPASKPLVEQFRGEVPRLEVLLMLAVRRPGQDTHIQNFFDALRLWTLIQSMRRTRTTPQQDELINRTAEKLRLVADGTSDWLDLLGRMRVRIDSFETTSKELSLRSEGFKKSDLKEKHRVFLRTLSRVANGEAKLSTEVVQIDPHWLSELGQSDQPASPIHLTFDQDLLATGGEDGDGEPSRQGLGGIAVEVSEETSFGKRKLTGRGIQLRSAEQLQFLPWSWHTLNPIELAILNSKLAEMMQSPDVKIQTLAWLVEVAILTSRSLRLVTSIQLDQTPAEDWKVTRDFRMLHREPPRRIGGWRADKDQVSWIRPLASSLKLELSPNPVVYPEAPSEPEIKTLNDLWTRVSPNETAESAFNSLCTSTPGLHRVSSGMASSIFAGQIYLQSEDAVLAQILAMGPRAGLGGSSAYGSWPSSRVNSVLRSTGITPACGHSADDENAAGSELDALDDALAMTIRACEASIRALAKDSNKRIEHHNAVVSYVVMALLAATGARPVNDPFESPALFDWQKARVFLADKVSKGNQGRQVPLVASVFKLLNSYLKHLKSLAASFPEEASSFAHEIVLLADRKESKKLPFFFYIRETPCLSWDSVTERTLQNSGCFDWPLPANLMRPRLSIRLRSQLIDAEIIDAILGHSDQGVQSHGPESSRTWSKDMSAAMPALNNAYQLLGFTEGLSLHQSVQSPQLIIEPDQLFALTKPFGSEARAESRKKYRLQARAEARKLIEESIGEVPRANLTPEFWDRLSISLLTIDGKRPHPNADIRYGFLTRWQEIVSRRIKLKLKRMIVLDRGFDSVFTPKSIGCETSLDDLNIWFERVIDVQPASKIGVRSCLALATLDLAITCQIGSTQLLLDVLKKKNFRLVVLAEKTFLEYHPALDTHPSAPVARFRIPVRCAQWLNNALGSTYKFEMGQWEMPTTWLSSLPFQEVQNNCTVSSIVRRISQVVQQVNYLQRPGLVAGYLAGMVRTSAMPHPSWVLQEHGLILESTQTNVVNTGDTNEVQERAEEEEHSPLPLVSSRANVSNNVELNESPAQKASRLYVNGLTDLLRNFIDQSDGQPLSSQAENQSSDKGKFSRRNLVTALDRYVTKNKKAVSSAIWGLGHWAVHLTKIPRKKNTPYQISSVVRYLSALSGRFIEMGSEFDLVAADPEEITDFYDEVLELNREIDLNYVVERLVAFHGYMQSEFKIADADWQELDCGTTVPHGSPGILGVDQYRNALELLAPNPASATHEQVAGAFLLLLAFRFGLRAADSKGLTFQDFWLREKMIVIHVQSNELRKLKRPASRRVLPLVEELSKFEWSLIHQFIAQAELCRPDKGTFALFSLNSKGARFDVKRLSANINQILGRVCGDPNTTFYKARHGFANRMADALIGHEVRCFKKKIENTEKDFSAHASKLMLGTTGTTRRAPWALARLLGHARPRTSFKSYVHKLPAWSDTWSEQKIEALDQKYLSADLSNALILQVKNFKAWQRVAELQQVPARSVVLNPELLLSYLRLLRNGTTPKRAAGFHGLSEEVTDAVHQLLSGVEARVKSRTERAGRAPMQSLLNQISSFEWKGIEACCVAAGSREFNDWKSIDLSDAISMVSENRQLLMWKESHFEQVGMFIQYFRIVDDIKVIQTTSLHQVLVDWLEKHIPENLPDNDTFAVRMDPAEEGTPPRQIKHRCGAVINSARTKTLSTSYGMLLLWIIFVVLSNN